MIYWPAIVTGIIVECILYVIGWMRWIDKGGL